MKARPIGQCTSEAAAPRRRKSWRNADSKTRHALGTILGCRNRIEVMPWFFCISLWLSSLLALSMSRGWIALFFSGQMFSSGQWLFKSLVRRTWPEISSEPIEPMERVMR
jgi:hypothetical protein